MKYKILFIVLLLSVAAIIVNAQVNHRGHLRTQTQIRAGISQGEAFRLRHMKQDLRRDYLQAKTNDGRIGPLERRHLLQEKRKMHRAEFRFRNNHRF
jgi:hypothetical protein